jgi:predicted RNase H-like nuclease
MHRMVTSRRADIAGEPRWVAGVDGCRSGWLAVFLDIAGAVPPRLRLFPAFADILAVPEQPERVAVDMPIGLPDRIVGSGRAAEIAVRPLLGERQSSVFSVPARAAVMCDDYRQACRVALASSDPPRAVAKQSFALFRKIREVDALMTVELAERVIETHPEAAFHEANSRRPMSLPKKVKGRAREPGLEERRLLLKRLGFPTEFLRERPPSGASADDLLDACISAIVAKRHLQGAAIAYPEPPARDSRGLPVAIWV